MFFDFVEIGTSDFSTLIQEADESVTGLSIDPIRIYLDNLPDHKNCIKLNAGISNRDGDTFAYYLTPENIAKYELPEGVRGCNTIDQPHETVVSTFKSMDIKLEDVITCVKIPVYRLVTVFA